MQRTIPALLLVLTCVACGREANHADEVAACPPAVTSSVSTSFPGSRVDACKREKEQYEVKLTRADGKKAEADVGSDGTILQTEEKIGLQDVPPPVLTAFSAKYPSGKATGAEKQTRPGKGTTYEVVFQMADKAKEATFDEQGKFLSEE